MIKRKKIATKTLVYSILLSLVFLLGSCLNITDDPYEAINGNVNVSMFEQLDSTSRIFTLLIETEKDYDCSNYYINHDLLTTDSIITIRLKNIYKSNTCYTDRGPARAIIEFLNEDWNTHKIRIEMESFSREGIITNDSSEYRFDMPSSRPLFITNTTLKKVPDSTIWGSLSYNNLASKAYIDTFFMYMDTLHAMPVNMEDGQYNFFEVKNGAVVNPGSPNTNYSEVFLLKYTNKFDYIRNLANYISAKSGDVRIIISSSKAEYHDSLYPY